MLTKCNLDLNNLNILNTATDSRHHDPKGGALMQMYKIVPKTNRGNFQLLKGASFCLFLL